MPVKRAGSSILQHIADLPPSLALLEEGARISIDAIWTHTLSIETQQNPVTGDYDTAGYFGYSCRVDLLGGTCPSNRISSNFDYLSGSLDIHLA